MKKLFLFLLLGAILATGCSTTRKCNGHKGTKVPMGVM